MFFAENEISSISNTSIKKGFHIFGADMSYKHFSDEYRAYRWYERMKASGNDCKVIHNVI